MKISSNFLRRHKNNRIRRCRRFNGFKSMTVEIHNYYFIFFSSREKIVVNLVEYLKEQVK